MMNPGMEALRQEVIETSTLLEDAKRLFEERPSGTHPHDLAKAVQRHRRNINEGAKSIRSTFYVV
ncbi:hypothetical protein Ab1vBOLIVR5_gp32c [Agrobacterium phage OLIVR5]|uniref:Uncharacterized protein n=3 Tax=Caudoviricetes TaxID=2731619 RepID=A0A858MUU6_9CAUD|nr:hypothetical protein KNU99_gp032 [Agrobacterium phage OLIVR5]QIW87680.1 hypothetical protein Ab1vBOLIVR5_gp32c [Agrobacterium phage OLIVR5]QIW87942.1 hypothetical protein Ab1vBOLIVR6_gp35c [Agrobacterium phage OLIVR6]